MPTDYDNIYQEKRHALGKPTDAFVQFFENYQKEAATVLDVGCGQGRDALFIARLGHRVLGVDISPTGIAQLLEDAAAENLQIAGVVADLNDYEPSGEFDVIVVDRTLHMLGVDARLSLLKRLLGVVADAGYILIADEKSNLPAMRDVLKDDNRSWHSVKDTQGFLFMQMPAD